MQRILRLMVVALVVAALALATALPAFAIGPGDHSKADEHVSPVGHAASCGAQGVVIHSDVATGLPNYDSIHDLYAAQCPEADDVYH